MIARTDRYNRIAMFLHWTIALAIIGQIFFGWWMTDEARPKDMTTFEAFQLHKSIGLTILALSALRLLWRLVSKVPGMPHLMPAWQKFVAGLTHVAFYVLMFAIPLSGWVMVSSSVYNFPTMWFHLFEVPHLPGFADMAPEAKEAISDRASSAHSILVWATIGLLGLHVLAALKHQFVDKDGVLGRMVPFMR
jgi:cytochrome b561